MPTQIQIRQAANQALYFVAVRLDGLWWNTSTKAYETFNSANWSSYAVLLVAPIANSPFYFANVPDSLPPGVALLSLYIADNAGPPAVPASSDTQLLDGASPVVYVLDWSGSSNAGIVSIAPMSGGTPPQAQLPGKQDSLLFAQQMLDSWLSAEQQIAANPLAIVTVDGQSITYRDAGLVRKQVEYWRNRVAILSGKRRRASAIRMDRF